MSDEETPARKKAPKVKKRKRLKLEKRLLEPTPDDLALSDGEAADVHGGFAPPYVPVGPVHEEK